MPDEAAGRRTARKTSRKRANIPTGTVTFLFTDIEGSTAMWEDHPDQMQEALTHHDEILHAAVEARGGYVFKMIGDACCAAFGNAREALEATLAAQRALFAEPWDEHTTIRVRMALHTGVPEERGGDYFGPPVNRVARLLSAGHGGQILLSAVTYGLVRDVLRHIEPGAELRDLGEYWLRDLRYTERISQLVVSDLPADFPPPRGELITAGSTPAGEQETPRPQETPVVVSPPPPAARPERSEEETGAAPTREERYSLTRLIGSGGMAEVYLAHDQELDRNVALKVLRHQYADDERFVERFKREARNAASLSHPNIVAVHDRGETQDGAYYIVMEYMAGGTLKDRIEREGPLPAPVATALALQIAKALEAAHRRGVIHRDIKPQNVLLDEVGEAKVADFGIARAASSSTMTKVGSVMGTTHYISPEQALGEAASPRSDLYSLGVVLYEMLTGELPYDAETPMGVAMQHVSGELRPPREVRPEVPEGINAVTVRLLAKDPEERYGSAAELVEDLERVQRGVAPVPGAATPQAVAPVSTPPAHPPADRVAGERPRAQGPSEAPTVPQPVRPAGPAGGRGPLRWLLVAAALLGVLVVVGLGIVAWLLVPSPQQEGADLEVPSLEGRELAAARQEVGDDFELVSSERNSTEPKGTILEQRPEPGAEAREGEEISVVVSAGSGTAAVPTVVGRSRDEAEQTLESEGFEVRVETRRSSEEEAGKVVEQSPSDGEAKLGSEVAITVTEGPPPGYKYIEDPTGNFTAEVPSGWGVETGENSEKDAGPNTWSYVAGEYLISSLTTAPDLDAWYSTGTSGVYMVASKSLTQYSDYELTHSFLNANKNELCATTGPYEDYNRSPYSGKIQTWYECGVDAATTFAVAAAPEGRECVVVLNARISDEADREAIEHIIDTFEVSCGGIAGA